MRQLLPILQCHLAKTSALTVTQGAILVPDSASQAMFSPALTFILLIALPLIPFLIYLGLKGGQPAFRRKR
ncbi:hydrogenase 4 subunit B [Proteus mirabilis]|uniref:Hydrogenase 4 subunit B n=1 Tax=Proteus mirabilis TaxID=584 RepID=A0A379GBR2_PROMI|nr:hydrogenase 4 subunit B [Proteus mirabilis]